MTVKELKELLKGEPDDRLVIINSHDGEFDDINRKNHIQVIPYGNKNIWYYGTHVQTHEKTPPEEKEKAVTALLLQ